MIIKGGARARAGELADHLERADTNERVRVVELRDVAGANLDQALREMEALASGTRCKSPLYHANIDPRADEVMTPEQWARAVDALEEKLGLQGQPRAVVQHVKEGREHTHVVWSRIDLDHMRAIPYSHNYRKHEEVSRALEREFGHARVQGAHAEREGVPRSERTPSQAEMQQAARSQIDPKAVKAELSGLWRQTDTGKAFAAALEDAGYCLARGDKRDFIIVDQAGETHSLTRRIEGAKAKDISARMGDLDPAGLPDAEAAKAIQAERAAAIRETAGGGQDGRGVAEVPPVPDAAVSAPERSPPPVAETPAPAVLEPAETPDPVPAVDPAASPLEAQRRQLLDALQAARERPAAPVPAPLEPEEAAPAEPEAQPGPVTFVESVTAALDTQRRQLLAILRRVWERRAEMLAEPETKAEAPAADAPALHDPAAEKRRQLLDAMRRRQPEAAPVAADQTPGAAPAEPTPFEPVPIVASPAMPEPESPAIDTAAQRRQLADAERRARDPRIEQEERQLAAAQARQDAAGRKALETQHAAEWRRLEKAEASRAKRDGTEEARIIRAEAAEDKANKPGLFGRLKSLLSPAAAQERQEQQERIEARRAQDRDDRLTARQERDARERAALEAAQARARESDEDARAARHARELEELRQRQRDREARELERGTRERDGRGGDGRGGRDGGGRGGWER